MGAGILVIGSITLVGGAYIASRWIARWWESFIAFGERRYSEVYGDVIELPEDAKARASLKLGAGGNGSLSQQARTFGLTDEAIARLHKRGL